jgi:hypothetical protein
LLGLLAAAVGLAEYGEELNASNLVERFSWNRVAAHAQEVCLFVPDEYRKG